MLSVHIFVVINNSFTEKKVLKLALNLMSPIEAGTKLDWPAWP